MSHRVGGRGGGVCLYTHLFIQTMLQTLPQSIKLQASHYKHIDCSNLHGASEASVLPSSMVTNSYRSNIYSCPIWESLFMVQNI